MSRLKNRTMEEIITRWASDLTRYQKEFQDQAVKVATWDRLLVENGEKIMNLYNATHGAERDSREVEKQLTTVENNQRELEEFLDHYEHEVDQIASQQGGVDTLQGPDQERERTYKLAENLGQRLDEMGKGLTEMIQSINETSATLNKSTKPDDPVSLRPSVHVGYQANTMQLQKIVKVLNGHLSQLQWIDENAASLQAKVAAAQKENHQLGASVRGGVNEFNTPADDIFRSYLGRR